MDNAPGLAFQILQSVFVVLAAPLVMGWVNQCRARLQNRSAPSLWLPYYTLAKLFHKDAVIARDASPLFRITPYILFGCMWLAAGIVPGLAPGLPRAPARPLPRRTGPRSSACSRWRACSPRLPRWTSARRSAAWVRAARC